MTNSSGDGAPETGSARRSGPRFGPKLRITVTKFAATSAAATVASHITVGLLFWTHWTTAGVALVVSYLVGVLVNYFVNRRWTWGRRGRAKFRTEVFPFLVIVGLYGIGTVGLGKLLHMWVGPLAEDTPFRGLALNACVLAANALLLVPKFVGLDRVFRTRRAPDGSADTSTTWRK